MLRSSLLLAGALLVLAFPAHAKPRYTLQVAEYDVCALVYLTVELERERACGKVPCAEDVGYGMVCYTDDL